MNPDRMTQWLKTATGPLLAIGGLAGAVAAGAAYLQDPIAKLSFIGPQWAFVLAILLPAGAAALLLAVSYRLVMRRSRLLRPERFDLRVRSRDDLFGRDADIDDLQELVQRFDLVFVDGESGSGKSSLVRFGLVPALAADEGLLPILVAQYRGDWDLGLSQQVHGLLWSALGEANRNRLGIAERPAIGSVNAASLARLLADVAERLGRQVLLIFDQFDDYQLAHRAHFLSEQRAWISAATLTEANAFWKVVETGLASGQIRLMVVTRSDASGGLHSVRFTEANASRPVLRLAGTWLPRLFDQLTAGDGRGAVVADPESGWTDLKRLVELDLDRGDGILPQQVRTTLLGLRELPALTPADYRRAGRAEGAEALYIRDAIKWAAQSSGLGERQVRSMLLEFVERGAANSVKTRLRSDGELARLVPDDEARSKALARLGRDGVVRAYNEGAASEQRWQLDHDYLAAAVVAEERLTNPSAVLLRDKADAWQRTAGMGWWQRYRALLPVGTQLALAWTKLRGWRRFSYKPHRRFAALSLLKPAPFAAMAVTAIGWSLWISSPDYQIRRMIADAPRLKSGDNADELAEWTAALTYSGRRDEALAVARALENAGLRAHAFAGIVGALNVIGDRPAAAAAARETVAVLQAETLRTVGMEFDTFIALVDGVAAAGERKAALNLARKMARSREKQAGAAGSLSENPRAFQSFGRSTWLRMLGRDETLSQSVELAKLFRRLGSRDEALAVLRNAREAILRDRTNAIPAAKEFHHNGDDRAALALAAAPLLPHPLGLNNEAYLHARRADLYRQLGLADRQAAEIRAAATPGGRSARAFGGSLARLFVRNGRPEPVFALAGEANRDSVALLMSAAAEASRLGDAAQADRFADTAAEMARAKTAPNVGAMMLLELARGFEVLENPGERRQALVDALAKARAIDEDAMVLSKLGALVSIGAELAELEADDVARDTLDEAAELSERMTDDPSFYLADLAGALALSGQIREARLTAEQVRDGTEKLRVFASALSGYAQYRDPSLRRRLEAEERKATEEVE